MDIGESYHMHVNQTYIYINIHIHTYSYILYIMYMDTYIQTLGLSQLFLVIIGTCWNKRIIPA